MSNGPGTILTLLCAIALGAGQPLYAQQEPSAEERTKEALEDARRELTAERERIKREDQAQQQELRKATERRGTLTDELVERRISVARKEALLEKLREQRAELRTRAGAAAQDWADLRRIAADLHQRLSDFLETLPPSEKRARQRAQLMLLDEFLARSASGPIDLYPVLQLLESLIEESHTTARFKQTIRNAEGAEEPAEILRVGQILFASRVLKSGNIALAQPGPDNEAGYRWNENLPTEARAELASAFEGNIESGVVLTLPLDVTQQLAGERSYGAEGLWATVLAGGPVMIPLALIALLAVILILERIAFLSLTARGSTRLAGKVLNACRTGDPVAAQDAAGKAHGPVARTMAACLKQRDKSIAAMEDAISEAVMHELPRLERFLSAIGTLAGVAPLLGLLGTVTGMIVTFDMITVFGSGEPRMMAGGISQALITTATGLIIAIPVLLVHSYLRGRVDRIVADTERYAATLLNLLRGGPQPDKGEPVEGVSGESST